MISFNGIMKCRSFISIIFSGTIAGILPVGIVCRSFISIIVPYVNGHELNNIAAFVSILYKYHISQKAFDKKEENVTVVSILYKYHISLQNTTMKKQPSSSCRSFISIIFPPRTLKPSGKN